MRAWSLRPGQLVIIDEASMAATADLDAITAHARAAGAKVPLVGDPAQLSSVGAGGAFALLAGDGTDPRQLVDVRRFQHAWEREATLALRAGKAEAIETYDEHGRVTGGERDAMLDALFAGWQADVDAGRRSLMTAAGNQTVTNLNSRARGQRVTDGTVQECGVVLADGGVAGVGDLIVTRRNNRALATGTGWVKNGDAWTITKVHRNGGLVVTHGDDRRQVCLPAAYVADHVELGYATTAHRAQGRTVDTARAFVDITTAPRAPVRDDLQGSGSNRLYVEIASQPGTETPDPGYDPTAVEVLHAVIAYTAAEQSDTAWAQAHSVGQLSAEYQAIAATTGPGHDASTGATEVAEALHDRVRAIRAVRTAGALEPGHRRQSRPEVSIRHGL